MRWDPLSIWGAAGRHVSFEGMYLHPMHPAPTADKETSKIGSKKEVMKEPKEILLESANYFGNRAQWLPITHPNSATKTRPPPVSTR
jgi:hypothetical protein